MPNLLDTIQQNRQQLAGQSAPLTDETQQAGTLLRAKSGKQVTGGDATASNLGEQQAVQNTQSQLGQLGQQIQLQGQQEQQRASALQQQDSQQRQQIDQAQKYNTVQNRLQTQSILSDLQRQKGSLSTEKQEAGLEQAAFLMSMQDKQYTDTLQDVGKRRRLDEGGQFRSEMQDLAFGQQLDILKQKLGNSDILAASDRDFQKALSSMSISDAQKIAAMENSQARTEADVTNSLLQYQASTAAKQANTQAMYRGIGTLVSGGLAAGSLAANSKPAAPAQPGDPNFVGPPR